MLFSLDSILFIDCRYDLAGAAVLSEFAEVDALPGAKVEFGVGDRDCEADAEEGKRTLTGKATS